MQLFENQKIKVKTNKNGMGAFLDIGFHGKLLDCGLDNTFGDRPYNKNLTIHLDGVVDMDGVGNVVVNKEVFKDKLADKVMTIVIKNFLDPNEIKREVTLTEESFTEKLKVNSSIRALNKSRYNQGTTKCSKAAQESAQSNFCIILPRGNALDAFTDMATSRTNQTEESYQDNIIELQTLSDLGANGMYGLGSKYLKDGCMVLDIGYESTATEKGRLYDHRNIAYYCYDTKEWYVLDPVSSFGNAATSNSIPLKNALSDKYSPMYMRYYKTNVGIYKKDA